MNKKILSTLMILASTSVFATSMRGDVRLPGNELEWYFDGSNGGPYNSEVMVTKLINTLNELEQKCNVNYVYKGRRSVTSPFINDGVNTFSYASISSDGHAMITFNNSTHQIQDADVVVDRNSLTSINRVSNIARHEFLHAIGFDHTDEYDSIMAYPYNEVQTQNQYRPYDIAECQRVYGAYTPRATITKDLQYVGSHLTATVSIQNDVVDIGASRAVYMIAVYQGLIFTNTSSGWRQVNSINYASPYIYIDRTEATYDFTALSDFDTAPFSGVSIFIGYGKDMSDIIENDRYILLELIAP